MSHLKSFIRRILNRLLGAIGYVPSYKIPPQPLLFDATLRRTLKRGLEINTVIDIGASNGEWTKKVRTQLPDAYYLLIEANGVHQTALDLYIAISPKINYELVAASDSNGKIYFDSHDPFGGIADHNYREGFIELPTRTVDSLVQEHQLKPPYLLKLDTHGFEVPIFEGASDILDKTNLIVVEVYNFYIEAESLLFYELCDYLRQKGFRVIDICEPLHRKYDDSFWQMDLFFVREDRKEFYHNAYL